MIATRVAVVDIVADGWTAGAVYTRTAASALGGAALTRPDVQVFRVSRDVEPVPDVATQVFARGSHDLPVEAHLRKLMGRGARSMPLPGERRARQALGLPNPQDPVWVAKHRGMDVAFPVCAVPPRDPRMGLVGWIPDLQHINLPHFFPAAEVVARDRQFKALAERCHRLVFSSQTVRQEFDEHFPGFEHKARTVRFPSRFSEVGPSEVDTSEIYGLQGRYFLCANQFWKHKNHELVIEALAEAVSVDPHVTCVFTGMPTDSRDTGGAYVSGLLQLIAKRRLTQNALVLGLVPKPHLEALLVGSAALIQPSLSEGWNTSVEDAKALGVPVIALDTAVLREQAPQATFVVDRPGDLARAMLGSNTDSVAIHAGRELARSTAESFGPALLETCLEAAYEAR